MLCGECCAANAGLPIHRLEAPKCVKHRAPVLPVLIGERTLVLDGLKPCASVGRTCSLNPKPCTSVGRTCSALPQAEQGAGGAQQTGSPGRAWGKPQTGPRSCRSVRLARTGEPERGRDPAGLSVWRVQEDETSVSTKEAARAEAAAVLERKMAAMEAVLAARRTSIMAPAEPAAARGPGADLRFQVTHAGPKPPRPPGPQNPKPKPGRCETLAPRGACAFAAALQGRG
jgi:hypothetical protein